MIMRIEMEHNIEPGRTREVIGLLRDINATGSTASRIQLVKHLLAGGEYDEADSTEANAFAPWDFDAIRYMQSPHKIRGSLQS